MTVGALIQRGGCLCGAVRFVAGHCRCTRCRRRTGTASSAQAFVADDTFAFVRGEELVQGRRHPDGGMRTCFCRACGAHLVSRDRETKAVRAVRMAAFDGDPGVRPSLRAFAAYAAPWEPIPDDGLERFAESRPR